MSSFPPVEACDGEERLEYRRGLPADREAALECSSRIVRASTVTATTRASLPRFQRSGIHQASRPRVALALWFCFLSKADFWKG